MRDLPVDLGGYTLIVSEAPSVKKREQDGQTIEVVDRLTNAKVFTVSLFAKLRAEGPGGRRAKGEEIRVTLETDPGEGFDEGASVALVNARVSPYSIEGPYGTNAGISFKAVGLAPAPVAGRRSRSSTVPNGSGGSDGSGKGE